MGLYTSTELSRFSVLADCSVGSGNLTCETGLPKVDAGTKQVQQILSVTFGIVAALAVLMIVLAGTRLIAAQGNPQEVAKARGTIIYALIGLVIAIIAEAIVAFVIGNI